MTEQTSGLTQEQGPGIIELSVDEAADVLEDLPGGQSVSAATRRFLQELHNVRRRGAQVLLAADVPEPDTEDDIIHGPLLPVRQAPEREPQRLYLICTHDVSGSTGVGVIAEACRFSDGATVVRVLESSSRRPGWRFYDGPGTDAVLKGDWGVNVIDVVQLDASEPG